MLWLLLCLVLIVAPVICVLRLGGRIRWILLGITSWILGVFVKNFLFYLLDAWGMKHWPAGEQALVSGMLSAACELGAAAIFLRKHSVSLIDAIGFGVAIGSFEIIFTLGIGILEGLDESMQVSGSLLDFVSGAFVLERLFALLGHTASRALVFVALQRKAWVAAAIGFVTFSFVDRLAAYGLARNWNWEDVSLNLRFQITVAAISMLEAIAAGWFLQRSYAKQFESARPVKGLNDND